MSGIGTRSPLPLGHPRWTIRGMETTLELQLRCCCRRWRYPPSADCRDGRAPLRLCFANLMTRGGDDAGSVFCRV
ncbi:hypothetical protein LNQ52_00100 [Klebsiella pneumoniae subsp. pneumoniae]|nr:hypothetical protein [Klebsiella pneumoniae subsp. pneumoniae]